MGPMQLPHDIARVELESRNRICFSQAQEKLHKLLEARPSIALLLSKGYLTNLHISKLLQPAAWELQRRLKQRRAKAQLFREGIFLTDRSNEFLVSAFILETKLKNRPSISQLAQQGVYVISGTKMSRVLQPAARTLELKLSQKKTREQLLTSGILKGVQTNSIKSVKDLLECKLDSRSSEAELVSKGIKFMSMSRLSYALQPAASELDSRIKLRRSRKELRKLGIIRDVNSIIMHAAHYLENKFYHRPSTFELKARGIMFTSNYMLSNILHSAASELEQKLNQRRSLQQLYDLGIIPRVRSNMLQPAALELERKLLTRPRVSELVDNGVLLVSNVTLARSLQPTASILEPKLENRRTRNELSQLGILPRGRANSLQASAVSLRLKLSNRPSTTELVARGVLSHSYLRISPALQGAAYELEPKLRIRRTKQQLYELGMIPRSRANSIQAPAVNVECKLSNRPSIEELERRGICHFSNMKLSRALQSTARDLQMRLNRRRTRYELQQLNILQTVHSNNLQNAASDLKSKLGGRSSAYKLRRLGVLLFSTIKLSPCLHPAARDLEPKLRQRRTKKELQDIGVLPCISLNTVQLTALRLKRLLDQRSSITELFHKGILKSENIALARALQPAAIELAKGLAQRRTKAELVTLGILPKNRASKLQAAAISLERKLKRGHSITELQGLNLGIISHLKQSWVLRPSAYELELRLKQRHSRIQLYQRGILPKRRANLLQSAAVSLEDKLRKRPRQRDLARRGILPFVNPDLCRHLYPVATQVNSQLMQRHSKADLQERGILPRSRANKIQAAAVSVLEKLENRPSEEELLQRGIQVGKFVQLRAHIYQQRRANLEKQLQSRDSLSDLIIRGIFRNRSIFLGDSQEPKIHTKSSILHAKVKAQNEKVVRNSLSEDEYEQTKSSQTTFETLSNRNTPVSCSTSPCVRVNLARDMHDVRLKAGEIKDEEFLVDFEDSHDWSECMIEKYDAAPERVNDKNTSVTTKVLKFSLADITLENEHLNEDKINEQLMDTSNAGSIANYCDHRARINELTQDDMSVGNKCEFYCSFSGKWVPGMVSLVNDGLVSVQYIDEDCNTVYRLLRRENVRHLSSRYTTIDCSKSTKFSEMHQGGFETRSNWEESSLLQIFSTSARRWMIGRVLRIFTRGGMELLEVYYYNPSKNRVVVKHLEREDSRLRPIAAEELNQLAYDVNELDMRRHKAVLQSMETPIVTAFV